MQRVRVGLKLVCAAGNLRSSGFPKANETGNLFLYDADELQYNLLHQIRCS